MNPIDRLLNYFTMYRVTLYGLLVLVVYSFILSFLKILSFSYYDLVVLLILLISTCYVSNLLFARLFKVPFNTESSLITSLILYFLLWPSIDIHNIQLVFLAGIVAMASKYIISYKGKHLANPAAIGAVSLAFFNSGALWWIGTISMLPAVLVVGLLIVRKTRKFTIFLTFLCTSVVIIFVQVLVRGHGLIGEISQFFISFPVIFFGTIMLTEPLTLPPTKKLQIIYAAIAGILFSWQGSFGPLLLTTELGLVIANLFSFFVSPKYKLKIKLIKSQKIAKDTYEFTFPKPKNFIFKSGQYLEWTIPMQKTDARGNRRYFTIASSPTEKELKIGIRLNLSSSLFKKFLVNNALSKTLLAGNLAGDFILKENTKNLVFIAGGIGITPFRSMIKKMLDTNAHRNLTLFYSNKTVDEIAYKDLFGEAKQKLGLQVIYLLTDEKVVPKNFSGEKGRLSKEIIYKYLETFDNTDFYLSGPIAMVNYYKKLLNKLGIKSDQIVTDYFPGF